MNKHESLIKGWLNMNIVKEFLTIKMEIDLNHIDLTPGNAALFGFKVDEPLLITFSGKETKFLNMDEDASLLGFKSVWNFGMLEFSV